MKRASQAEITIRTSANLYAQGVIIDILTTTIKRGEGFETVKSKLEALLEYKDQALTHCVSINPDSSILETDMGITEETKNEYFMDTFEHILTNYLAQIST